MAWPVLPSALSWLYDDPSSMNQRRYEVISVWFFAYQYSSWRVTSLCYICWMMKGFAGIVHCIIGDPWTHAHAHTQHCRTSCFLNSSRLYSNFKLIHNNNIFIILSLIYIKLLKLIILYNVLKILVHVYYYLILSWFFVTIYSACVHLAMI